MEKEIKLASLSVSTSTYYCLVMLAFFFVSLLIPFIGLGLSGYLCALVGFFSANTARLLISKHHLDLRRPLPEFFVCGIVVVPLIAMFFTVLLIVMYIILQLLGYLGPTDSLINFL